jgi:hypothetical protein
MISDEVNDGQRQFEDGFIENDEFMATEDDKRRAHGELDWKGLPHQTLSLSAITSIRTIDNREHQLVKIPFN